MEYLLVVESRIRRFPRIGKGNVLIVERVSRLKMADETGAWGACGKGGV